MAVDWPGIPSDKKVVGNLEFEDDLFSSAELNDAISASNEVSVDEDDDTDEDEESIQEA